ncbi:hypothetical protein [Agaribacter flavus]|uniref:Uncharacterized protein n=1 Tax=Agaribacter flavus TaxID=1902781 RepID=A0ABV7FPX1_9ALTE
MIKSVRGLYALDTRFGTHRDAGIRDYPFVTGYAWRFSWADFEISKDNYDFTALNYIVNELAKRNQKLSWILMPTLPEYLVDDSNIETWQDGQVARPSPWDEELHLRFAKFIASLAEHKIIDPALNDQAVAFRDHSVLNIIHPSMPGLPRGSLRDSLSTAVNEVPGYSRDKLQLLLRKNIELMQTEFPLIPLFYSLWKIHDEQSSPSLWEASRDTLLTYENMGLWQDNLAANRPCENCEPVTGLPVVEGLGEVFLNTPTTNGFQMLGSWEAPFNERHVPKLAFGKPADGIDWAYRTYNASYFEIYSSDLDNPEWHDELTSWANKLAEMDE